MLALEAGYPEINLVGNGTSIADGDTTPSTTDDTDFGSHTAGGANLTRTFTIENTGTANLDLTGSPNVAISGSADFSISSQPLSDPVSASGSTTFDVQLDPTNTGTQTATISIANDDSDENPYTFDVSASISAANTSPTVSGTPSDITVTEDTESNVDLSSTVFADADGDNLTVTLSASAGTFSSPVDGSGVGAGVTETLVDSTTISLAGAPGDINTYLDTASNIRYTPASNVSGNDQATITISATDGNGGSLSSDPVVNIDVVAVNDPPTASGVPTDVTVTEDTASNFDLSSVTFTDVDGDSLTVALAASSGTFSATSGGGVTIGGSGTGVLTFSGTPGDINTYLDTISNIQYTGPSNVNGDNAATFTLHANDGTVNPQVGSGNIDIAAVNDAPTASGVPTDVTVTEDTASNFDLSTVSFADVDGDSLTVTLAASSGTFSATSGGGVTIGGSGSGSLSLSGTVVDINTYLDTASNIQYTGASDVSGDNAATFTLNANDGTVNPQVGGGNIDIAAVNDAPTASGVPTDVTVTEDTASNFDLSPVTFTDVDGDSLTVVLAASSGTFSAASGGGVTIGGSGSGSLSLSGTVADINTYLDTVSNIQYTGALDVSGDNAATFTLNANDGTVNPQVGSGNIDITAVNDPPTLSLGTTSGSLDENNTPPNVVTSITIDDDGLGTNNLSLSGADAGSFQINGGNLEFAATADFETQNSYSVTVEVDDTAVGSTPDDSATFTLTINDVNEAPTLTLGTTSGSLDENNTPPNVVTTITIDDDGLGTNNLSLSGADAGSFQINGGNLEFTATADFETQNSYSVTVEVDDTTVGSTPDDSATFTLTINDVNDPPTLSLGATSGSLDENNTPPNVVTSITVNDDGLGTNNLSLGGADAGSFQINGGNLEFTATADFETQNSYSVTVNVDDTTVGGTPDDSATFTLTINDVNEAPTITLSNTVTTLPDDTDTTTRVKVADIVVDDDALGSNTTSLAGADSGVFEIDGTELFLSAGTPLDATADSDLAVSVQVDDTTVGPTPDDTAALAITVTDATPPTVAITSGVADPTSAASFQVTITFNEPVTGFVVGDIGVTNGSASNLSTGDDTVFTADISPAADGSVTVDVPAGVAQDAAGNDNQAATPFSVVFDSTAPILQSIARLSPTDEVTNADTLTFRATFDTDVQNVDPADFTATGTTATLAVSTVTADSVFDLTVSGGDLADLDATVGIDLAAGQDIVDAAGNALPGSEPATDETYTVDNTAPSVTVDSLITSDDTPPLTGTVDDNDATLEVTVDGQTLTATNNGDGTWALADDTLAALANATYDVAATATDPAGNAGSDATTDELTITPDTDGDGVDGSVEDAGPNGGDANNDGTPDSEQPDVTTLPTVTGRGYMTVQVSGACAELQGVAAVDPASLPTADPAGNPYPFGLVEFELPCETATVDVVYHAAVPGDLVTSTYRKYGPVTPGDPATADWYDFSDYASLNGTTWTLDLADNRLGDDTGDDGLIVDQGGPARGRALPIPANQPWALWLLIAVSLLLAHRSLSRAGRKTF